MFEQSSHEHNTDREIALEVSVQEVFQQLSPEHKTDREIMPKGPLHKVPAARWADVEDTAGSACDDAAEHGISTARIAKKKAKKKVKRALAGMHLTEQSEVVQVRQRAEGKLRQLDLDIAEASSRVLRANQSRELVLASRDVAELIDSREFIIAGIKKEFGISI